MATRARCWTCVLLCVFWQFLAAVPLTAAAAPSKDCPADPWTVHRPIEHFNPEYRLPRTVIPQHYDIRIDINIGDDGKFDFKGHVSVLVEATEAASNITMHSQGLAVEPVRVVAAGGGEEVAVEGQRLDLEQEQLRVELADQLQPHKQYLIHIDFQGNLTEDHDGLFRTSYVDRDTNTTKWLAVTQFEATYAREAFPCFDEPDMKATFSLQVGHNENLTALSNMPAEKTEPMAGRPGFNLTSFSKTVPMSTYLLAIVVSDFEVIKSERNGSEAQSSIWARRTAADQMDYAKDVAPKALAFFEDYFDIRYPLPKQDMVAVPDFSSGAMENWGLIIYSEAWLLFDNKSSSKTAQSGVAVTLAHELAHQWFGNLVTMRWWSDLWLNEGFATYMSALGVSRLHPDWKFTEESTVYNWLNLLSLDALESTRPVVRPVENASQVSQTFDPINYSKGSVLLSMMHSFLGEKAFRSGVSSYLKQHKYGSAEQDDLWEQLTAAAREEGALPDCLTVKTIMDTWTVQSGYPVVTVSRDYDKGTANVSQERYFSSGASSAGSPECWYVPLWHSADVPADAIGPRPAQDWLRCKDAVQTVAGMPARNKWVLFNPGMAGLYRVLYDQENWRLITAALADPEQRRGIDSLSRAQVIEDAFELAYSQRLSHDVPFKILSTMHLEEEFQPWRVALVHVSRLNDILWSDHRYSSFRAVLRRAIGPVFKKLGRLRDKADGFHQIMLKNRIAEWACRLDVEDCVEQARGLFAEWQATADPDKVNPIPQDIRLVSYCAAIYYGTSRDWAWLWKRYLNSNVASSRNTILAALSFSRDDWILQRFLHWTLDKNSGILRQDASAVFGDVASSTIGLPIATKFLFRNFEKIVKLFGSKSSEVSSYVSTIASCLTEVEDYKQLKDFIADKSALLAYGSDDVAQSLEDANQRVQWMKNHADELFSSIASLSLGVVDVDADLAN